VTVGSTSKSFSARAARVISSRLWLLRRTNETRSIARRFSSALVSSLRKIFRPLDGAQERRQGRGRCLKPRAARHCGGSHQSRNGHRRRDIVLVYQQMGLLI